VFWCVVPHFCCWQFCVVFVVIEMCAPYIPTVCSVCVGVLVVMEMWAPFPAGARCSGALSHTSAVGSVWVWGFCSYGNLSHLSPLVQGFWHFVLQFYLECQPEGLSEPRILFSEFGIWEGKPVWNQVRLPRVLTFGVVPVCGVCFQAFLCA